MKIISWNVNGIRSVFRKGFLDFIEERNPDIVCIQEIKSQEIPSGDLFSIDLKDRYNIYINSAEKLGYSGVAVLSKEKPKKVKDKLGMKRFDTEGRFLELVFPSFTLINIYIPHGARDKRNLNYKLEVYERLLDYLGKKVGEKIIITGDFNIAHKEIDLARPKGNINNIMFTFPERMQITKLIELGFIDLFRDRHETAGNYTWWPYRKGLRERNVGWRIDYIFGSNNLRKKVYDAFILKGVLGSDHCPIGIIL